MPDNIKIEINDEELIKELKRLAAKTKDMTPIMRKISAKMHYAVEENFATEGARLGKNWADLNHFTKEQRSNLGKYPGAILNRSGSSGLIGSITSRYDNNSAMVGTNKVYAAIHQFGGTIKPKKGQYLTIPIKTKGKKKKFIKLKQVRIPARPFLALNNDDVNNILKIVRQGIVGE